MKNINRLPNANSVLPELTRTQMSFTPIRLPVSMQMSL